MADSASQETTSLPEPATLEVEDAPATGEVVNEAPTEEGSTEGQPGDSEAPKPGTQQAKSVFESLLENETPKPKQEELPPDVKPGSRAAETITNLRSRAQRAESEHANLQAVLGQTQQKVQEWAGQIQTQMQQLREENIALKTRMESMPKDGGRPKTEAETYVDQLTDRIRQQLVEKEVSPLRQELEGYKKQLQGFSDEKQTAAQKAEIAQMSEDYTQQALKLWSSQVMRGVPPEVAEATAKGGYGLILAVAAQNQLLDLPQAAAYVRRTILESANLISRHAATSLRKAGETGKQAGTTMPRGAADGTTKESAPDMDTLQFNGFETPMDWKDAGRPRLKALPKK